MLRGVAAPEPGELREHEPHPMTALAAAAQFGERVLICLGLRGHEPRQVERVVRHDAPVRMLPPSGRRRSWVHYGVMMPNLPEPHRFFNVMSIVGTPGVALFANDELVTTTP